MSHLKLRASPFNKLIFNSYNNAKRLFDLSEYYKEATDEDLNNFAKDELFFVKI